MPTVICGFVNKNTFFEVKFKLVKCILVMRLLILMLDSSREGVFFSMEMVTAQPIIFATDCEPCL